MSIRNFIKELILDVISDERTKTTVIEILGKLITTQILPLLPVAVAAASKAAVDEIVEKIPALEGVVDLVKVADRSRDALNDLIPDIDFGIPALDNLLDWWRPN